MFFYFILFFLSLKFFVLLECMSVTDNPACFLCFSRREMDSGEKETAADALQSTSFPLSELKKFMHNALSWPATDLTPDSSLPALQKLSSGQPMRLCLSPGMYACQIIENTASCLVAGASTVRDTIVSLTDREGESGFVGKDGFSSMAVFQQPMKIYSRASLVFHRVWFMNIVEVVGGGPVFFSQCLFGASTCGGNVVGLPGSSQFASVHLAMDGDCFFFDCDFVYRCGVAGWEGNNEVPAVTASGPTKLHILNSSFSGPGVVSTALALFDTARLEADYISVVRCGGHSLILRDKSSAIISRALFDRNDSGVWVKDDGKLDIRESSLELVRHGRSGLVLSDGGYCLAHKCIFSAWAAGPQSIGRCIVVAGDNSYVSLSLCELFWRNGEGSINSQELIKDPDPVPGSDTCEKMKDFGLCHVLLGGRSEATISRCVFRLPLTVESNGQSSVIGVLLRSVPKRDSITLYAVENTIVFGWSMEGDDVRRARLPERGKSSHTWGLVLPYVSSRSEEKRLRQLATMWMTDNCFLESNEEPLKDASLVYSSYEGYCRGTGVSLVFPEVAKNKDEDDANAVCSSTVSFMTSDFVNSPPVQDLENHSVNVHWTPRKSVTSLLPGGAALTPSSLCENSPPWREHTCPEQGYLSLVEEESSDSTSLTSYSGSEKEGRGITVAKRASLSLPEVGNSPYACAQNNVGILRSPSELPSPNGVHLHTKRCRKISGEAAIGLPDRKQEIVLEPFPQMTVAATEAPRPLSVSFATDEETPTSRPGLQDGERQFCFFAGGRRRGVCQRRQLLMKQEVIDCQRKLQSLMSRRSKGTIVSSSHTGTAQTQKVRNSLATKKSNARIFSELFPYQSELGPRRRPLLAGRESPSERLVEKDNVSSKEVWPWEVPTLRRFLMEKLGMYSSIGAQERAFRGRGKDEEREEGEDLVWPPQRKRAPANRVNVGSLNGNSRGMCSTSPRRETRLRSPSLVPTPVDSFFAHRPSPGKAGFVPFRLYEQFWKKWCKTHFVRESSNQPQRDQREGECRSRGEMEHQAPQLHSSGNTDKKWVPATRVAGSARNYAFQQRDATQPSKIGELTAEVRQPSSAVVVNQTLHDFSDREEEKAEENDAGHGATVIPPRMPVFRPPLTAARVEGRNRFAFKRRNPAYSSV
ncbi:hypothetical protein, conserved [Trypanosoma cruzi]|uniref:Right handed beta helix domain-containing protein n=2 Tax=Trypanosoma cruzi TaxID=5693 RepID=Q4DZZ1_TRYCC|nr:hypothetical protein, conserved [Trypanosoma cruzi]EAN98101.1 hypothetical protein, conserved [Trypanosoma cruzi]|eukprot:XP_819952.1 hypothetical protein [Trypanosoma cruzi strain CL Brener]